MPLFDYKCRGCGHTFEHLTRGGVTPDCPACGNADVEKLMSMFSVGPPAPTKFEKEKAAIERAGWVQVGKPFKTPRRY